jgi:hypothetical protein
LCNPSLGVKTISTVMLAGTAISFVSGVSYRE